MKLAISTLGAALLCVATAAPAAEATPAVAKASSAPAVKKVQSTPGGGAPAVGGNGGGLSSNGGNTGTYVGPKKPKCPDPTVACPAEKVISK